MVKERGEGRGEVLREKTEGEGKRETEDTDRKCTLFFCVTLWCPDVVHGQSCA
jgi:hypothetical protein